MKFRKGFWIYFPVALFAWISPVGVSTANAESFTTTSAEDYFFTLDASQLFTVRTYAQQYGIDSMLWLYDSNNQVLAANDDWFGLDSYISMNLNAGTYRLRTGVCCGDPNRWYGTSYVVDVNIAPSNAPTTTTSTTTTLPPLGMNTPTNLQAVAGFESVSLTWDPPQGGPGYAEVERYAVFFSSDNWQSSFAIASTTTSVTVNNLTTGVTYQFRVRADNDTLGVYSSTVETYTVSATPVTTTSTTSTTTTTTTSTTTTTEPPTTTTESTTTTSTEPQPTTTSTSTTSTTVPEPSTTLVENTTSTTTTSTLPPVPEPIVEVPTGTTSTTVEEAMPEETLPEETTTTTEPETTTTEAYPEPTYEETTTTTLEPNLEPNLEPLTEEEITAVVEELTIIEEITPEVLSEVVDALNSDSITEEQVQAIVDAVVENLDTFTEITPEVLEEVLNVLESDSVTEEQVQEIVETILDTDISSDQATQLATSAAVLESITGDQATEVFASIDTGELSGEEAAAIVEALLEAPTEVKEAFEEEINVFEGGFDEYVPTDSTISVGARRVVVAATTVSFILPAPVVSRRQSIV
jgi:polyhydroxyalkanoate synthesis regulator phasin